MNPFNYLALTIMSLLFLIALLILNSFPKSQRKDKIKDFLLIGLILAILNVLIINFLMMPLLTPSPKIEINCNSGYFSQNSTELTFIEIHNAGFGNAEKVVFAIEHPSSEIPIKFRNPDYELFCEIKNYAGEEEYYEACPNKKCKAYSEPRTWIICESIPAGFVLELYTEDWSKDLTFYIWGENIFSNTREVNCNRN